jgi:hypothetical protein
MSVGFQIQEIRLKFPKITLKLLSFIFVNFLLKNAFDYFLLLSFIKFVSLSKTIPFSTTTKFSGYDYTFTSSETAHTLHIFNF